MPLAKLQPASDFVAGTLAKQRFETFVLGAFAFVALLLATIGLYGVMMSLVRDQTRDIGIRIALGASVGRVRAEVLGRAGIVVGIGAIAGLAGALAATFEPAAYQKLTRRATLATPLESLEDVKGWFRTLGLELETSESFGGRINAGARTTAESIVVERFLRQNSFVLYKGRIKLEPWEQCLRDWIRKFDRP